ncbi:MAG: hydrogenase maturation protease [Planctomycetota bacterium]
MPNAEPRSVLVLGYGNPGRLDDGLGPALAEAVARRHLPGLTAEADYQLTVEDAAQAAEYDVVLFADADATGPEPFSVRAVDPEPAGPGWSSHVTRPEAVLGLARELFGAEPIGLLLGIRGYEFDAFGERLSPGARANLDAAVAWVENAVSNGTFHEVRPPETEEGQTCRTEST